MERLIALFFLLFVSVSYATSIEDYIDLKQCDQIIDKQVYKICYSYKYKGALAVWYDLDGNLVNKNNIKKDHDFIAKRLYQCNIEPSQKIIRIVVLIVAT